jgi:glycerol kinase
MPSSPLYLAIDQGGHASRAIVFDQQGNNITHSEKTVSTQTPKNDWVEHDPDEMVDSVFAVINEAIDNLGSKRQQLVAAGLATQRSSIVCWDKITGEALSPIISWQDRRQHEWLQQFAPHAKEIHQRTGLFLSAHYGVSKLRWCLDNLGNVKKAHQQQRLTAGPLASYLIFKLTQEQRLLADPANASRTLLWNIHNHNWDTELVECFGLSINMLPICCNSQADYGKLALDNIDLPLTVVTGDQSAALFALGKPKHDATYINIGTGAFIQRLSGHLVESENLLTSVAYLDKQHSHYALEGTVNGAARALQWFAKKNNINKIEYKLPQWLEKENQPPLFLNGISGLGSPYWQADFESRFEDAGSIEAQAVAIVESIVFLIQHNLSEMQKQLGDSHNTFVSGGLAQLDGLCQRLADLTNSPVIRPQNHEATATGLAFLLAGQSGNWADTFITKTFNPTKNEQLSQRYNHWLQCMKAALKN